MSNDRNGTSIGLGTEQTVSADPYREEMWAEISRSWSRQASRHKTVRAVRVWGSAGLGLAVVLVAGVFLGRWSVVVEPEQQQATAFIDPGAMAGPLSMPYRVAVGEHFRDAETVLVLFDSFGGMDPELADRARDLAAASRMLATSDAGRDAEIRSILLELELLLVQISRLADDDPAELEIARTGVAESTALDRMRLFMTADSERLVF